MLHLNAAGVTTNNVVQALGSGSNLPHPTDSKGSESEITPTPFPALFAIQYFAPQLPSSTENAREKEDGSVASTRVRRVNAFSMLTFVEGYEFRFKPTWSLDDL